jgi:hypothetical protein
MSFSERSSEYSVSIIGWKLGRPRRRWEDNIKMDLREIGIDGANCIRLAQGRSTGGL